MVVLTNILALYLNFVRLEEIKKLNVFILNYGVHIFLYVSRKHIWGEDNLQMISVKLLHSQNEQLEVVFELVEPS